MLNLLLSARVMISRKELGFVIRDLLQKNDWAQHEIGILDVALSSMPKEDSIEVKDMILLYWLKHVDANLRKTHRFARNQIWIAKNIKAVLDVL